LDGLKGMQGKKITYNYLGNVEFKYPSFFKANPEFLDFRVLPVRPLRVTRP
jgi:hypothetical protein